MATSWSERSERVRVELQRAYNGLRPARQLLHFDPAQSFGTTRAPIVLLLGNHSAGKSTFINRLVGQRVQRTGRAPTDANFTVLKGGPGPEDVDGPTLVRSRTLGFSELSEMGPEFLAHLELRVVTDSELLDSTGVMLVDTPGMIDPPAAVEAGESADLDRGYDFKRVVRWFADRADVILMFFDPDKPGTTHETMEVLTSCLSHVAFKVHLVLNKVDEFQSVHDFARAYGTLCWNLAKVVRKKDMPPIVTMYCPREEGAAARARDDLHRFLAAEFGSEREQIEALVRSAPRRAIDNAISQLRDTAQRMAVHRAVLDASRVRYKRVRDRWQLAAATVAGLGALGALVYVLRASSSSASSAATPATPAAPPAPAAAAAAAGAGKQWKSRWLQLQQQASPQGFSWSTLLRFATSTALATAGTLKICAMRLAEMQGRARRPDWRRRRFEEAYRPQLQTAGPVVEDLEALWTRVEAGVGAALEEIALEDLPHVPTDDLELVLGTTVPTLDDWMRSQTAPIAAARGGTGAVGSPLADMAVVEIVGPLSPSPPPRPSSTPPPPVPAGEGGKEQEEGGQKEEEEEA